MHKLREELGVQRKLVVGDRGMVSAKAIAESREMPGMGWITALKTGSIRALVEGGGLQMDLFDERRRHIARLVVHTIDEGVSAQLAAWSLRHGWHTVAQWTPPCSHIKGRGVDAFHAGRDLICRCPQPT